jgi:fructan beta-fructosidase
VSWPSNGPLELTLFVDRGMVEIAAADGTVWITSLYFPADPEGEMRFERTSKTASAKV